MISKYKKTIVLAMIEEEGALIRTIRKRQRKWIGHILRGDSLLRTVIKGKWRGRKQEGDLDSWMVPWVKGVSGLTTGDSFIVGLID